MRNMSFFLTQKQIRARAKTVTRRLGWAKLKPGERFCAIVKGQGLKKGEKVKRLAVLECVSNTPEPLGQIITAPWRYVKKSLRANPEHEANREGFPEMTAVEFVLMFCRHMKVTPDRVVNRIEFRYVDGVK